MGQVMLMCDPKKLSGQALRDVYVHLDAETRRKIIDAAVKEGNYMRLADLAMVEKDQDLHPLAHRESFIQWPQRIDRPARRPKNRRQ